MLNLLKLPQKPNEDNGEKILSPMSVHFMPPSPEANAFVKEGDLVVEGDTYA